jgi:hypothetical protein
LFERERERAQQLQLARAHVAHFGEGDLLRAVGMPSITCDGFLLALGNSRFRGEGFGMARRSS